MKPLALLAALLLAGCSAPSAPPASPAASVQTSSTPTHTPTETEIEPPEPTKDDFLLQLKVREKECFGSAGCNVQFRIDVTWIGDGEIEDLPSYVDITYEVKGGEDPFTGTIEMEDGKYSRETEMISTRSSRAKLSVRVTDVESY